MSKIPSIKNEAIPNYCRILYAVEKECEDCGEWLYHSEDYELSEGFVARAITYFFTLEDALRVIHENSKGHFRIIKVSVEPESMSKEEREYFKRFYKGRGCEIVESGDNSFA